MRTRVRRRRLLAGALAAFALAQPVPASAVSVLSPGPQQSDVHVYLEPFATIPDSSSGKAPRLNAMASVGGRLFVVEESDARIWELTDLRGTPDSSVWFDVESSVAAATGRSVDHGNPFHGGLRSVAFHPDFATNGLFYTSLMEQRPASTASHRYLSDVASPIAADSVLVEWRVNLTTGVPDPSSYREVFRVGMAVYDHPIKQILFNPNAVVGDEDYGLLYIAHGDGSVVSTTVGGGQNNDALGKILRIDPQTTANDSFSVPASNPFLGNPSMIDAAYSIGHRNPHHLAFADVHEPGVGVRSILISAEPGRDNVEEINLIQSGSDYGWPQREGTFVHLASGGVQNGVAALSDDDDGKQFVYPAAQYGHTGSVGATVTGEAVAGGYAVDNGSPLDGLYLFADFAVSGELFHTWTRDLASARTSLSPGNPAADEVSELTQASVGVASIFFDHDRDSATPALPRNSLLDVFDDAGTYETTRADVRFGQGAAGELYVTSKRNNTVYLVSSSVPGGRGGPAEQRDETNPTVTLNAPAVIDRFNSPTTVDHSCNDHYLRSCEIWVDGVQLGQNAPLPRGQNRDYTIEVRAIDMAGNSATASGKYRVAWEISGIYAAASGHEGVIARYYSATFGRLPDNGGFEYWLDRLDAIPGDPDVPGYFTTSPEFVAQYGPDTTDEEFLQEIYSNVLGREPEPGGFEFWHDELRRKRRSRGQIMHYIAQSPEHKQLTGTT